MMLFKDVLASCGYAPDPMEAEQALYTTGVCKVVLSMREIVRSQCLAQAS